jgi:putative ABC transport system ATP-binding protein
MIVIEAHNLTKTYGTGGGQVEALKGVDLAVEKGTMLAIMGPSGSGKSTLLHLVGGIEVPTTGKVLLEGADMASMNDDERTIIRRRRIGFVFQAFNLLPTFTAEENVALPLLLDGISNTEATRRAAEMLDLVGLGGRLHHVPSAMSGGEQQRVAIARALVNEPALLLADEPTGNLDSAAGAKVIALLRSLVDRRQQTIVMVTHDPGVAAKADRLVSLRDGLIENDEHQYQAAAMDEHKESH